MWNGTAEILNSSPTAVVAVARKTIGSHGSRALTAAATLVSWVEPASPYKMGKPYTRKPTEKAPSSRYFMPASFQPCSITKQHHTTHHVPALVRMAEPQQIEQQNRAPKQGQYKRRDEATMIVDIVDLAHCPAPTDAALASSTFAFCPLPFPFCLKSPS